MTRKVTLMVTLDVEDCDDASLTDLLNEWAQAAPVDTEMGNVTDCVVDTVICDDEAA